MIQSDVLYSIADTLEARKSAASSSSYVASLFQKGEDAILDQELAISTMDGVAIQTAMPAIVQCFRWLDRLRANSG